MYSIYFCIGKIEILVCTDIATMGWHVNNLKLVVILGRCKSLWKYHQIGNSYMIYVNI